MPAVLGLDRGKMQDLQPLLRSVRLLLEMLPPGQPVQSLLKFVMTACRRKRCMLRMTMRTSSSRHWYGKEYRASGRAERPGKRISCSRCSWLQVWEGGCSCQGLGAVQPSSCDS